VEDPHLIARATAMSIRTLCLFAALAVLSGAGAAATAQSAQSAPASPPAPAQKPDKRVLKHRFDPYTKNDPELIKKAGYVRYGPFEYGDPVGKIPHTTDDIDKVLAFDKLVWIETPHFKLGCSLAEWTVPEESETKKKILGELTRLKERLPGINTTVKILDPWLRAHLFAMRLEDTYKQFQELIGYTDKDFPVDQKSVTTGGKFMGYGPHLGQNGKYCVLITNKATSYGEYLNKFIGKNYVMDQRHNFKEKRDSLFFGTAADIDKGGDKKHDTSIHCRVTFSVTINLLDGYKHYSYDLPVWMREGLGHWFERRISTQYNSYDRDEGSDSDAREETDFEGHARKLVTLNKFTPFSEAGKWRHYGDIKFNDHVAVWSRIDFMIATDKKKFGDFLEVMKSMVNPTTFAPDNNNMVDVQRDALQKIYGFSARGFDEKWREWVLKTYAAK
jgi:hypothetical protein